LLASTSLRFLHPKSKEWISYEIELPDHMKSFIERFEEEESDSNEGE
jgi:hypothetical protein